MVSSYSELSPYNMPKPEKSFTTLSLFIYKNFGRIHVRLLHSLMASPSRPDDDTVHPMNNMRAVQEKVPVK